MSEQDGAQSSTKQRRSRKTSSANQQNDKQSSAQHPANDDTEAWKAYWKAQGQPWHTEPEIDTERQRYLEERRKINPNIWQGIFPFKDIKLSRADVEWLLATHENGRGPVDWNEESQRGREGLDLRGANLRQEELHDLPLARLMGGLTFREWGDATEEQRNMAAVHLEEAHLEKAQLQGAFLMRAQLKKAHLWEAQLQRAHLWEAQLQEANLVGAQLQGAFLVGAQLQKADLRGAQLQGAHLERAQLQGVDLRRADLEHALLDQVTFSDQTDGPARLADINWGNGNLAVAEWGQVRELGDEHVAHQTKDSQGHTKGKLTRIDEYKEAVRANRQLATVLRDQGLNEDADRFAYRAQILQRVVVRWQKQYGRWLFSVFLAILTGYGYRLWRIVIAYGFIVSLCAVAYYILGLHNPPHLPLLQAFLESITAFHGRVFTELFNANTPQIWVTAFEAIAGLIIEGVFIAMLTQRFFGK